MADRGLSSFLIKLVAVIAGLCVLLLVALWGIGRSVHKALDPDPVTVATASLEGLKEQNRLSAFAARYVAVVTSRQSQLGLSSQKTLIMPGMVRYEVDLSKLQPRDVRWDKPTHTLNVTLPSLEVSPPAIDLSAMQEYGSGGLLSAITHANQELDAANRKAGEAELVRQAHSAAPMNLAREATRRAIARSFAMPLKAVGIDAEVKVRFAEEGSANSERWDVSRSIPDVMANRW